MYFKKNMLGEDIFKAKSTYFKEFYYQLSLQKVENHLKLSLIINNRNKLLKAKRHNLI